MRTLWLSALIAELGGRPGLSDLGRARRHSLIEERERVRTDLAFLDRSQPASDLEQRQRRLARLAGQVQ